MKMHNTIMDRLEKGLPVLIAEAGVNYYDIATKMGIPLMDAAKLMIAEAQKAGVHAIKFQSYKATELAAKESPSYWDLRENPVTSQRELFSHFDLFGEREYRELAEYSYSQGIEFLSTAFDESSADYLEPLMNVYKISSSDLSNIPFIAYQAKKGKPCLLSIGAAEEEEIDLAVKAIREHNDKPLVLLHCVLEYPTPLEDANLRKIATLKAKYPDCFIGYSDHTKPTADCDVIKCAYALGAQMIEKHYTLDKTLKGNDHFHGMDPVDASHILEALDRVEMLCGDGELKCLPHEEISRRNARRSLVSRVSIAQGQIVSADMLTAKRPGTGISPAEIDKVVGMKAKIDIAADVTLQYDMIEG
jgi:N-acetylneuraminate synthase